MIVRFTDDASPSDRDAVRVALASKGVEVHDTTAGYVLDRTVTEDDAIEIAAMPGVRAVTPNATRVLVLREAIFEFVIGANALLGALVIAAANSPASLGTPADPLHMPESLQPSWPLLPFHGALSRGPGWPSAPLMLVLLVVALIAWPLVGRRLAERHPRMHTAVGLLILVLAVSLSVAELLR